MEINQLIYGIDEINVNDVDYCIIPNDLTQDSPGSPRGPESPMSVVSSSMNTPRTPRSPSMVPGGSRSPQYLMSGIQTPPDHREDPDLEFTPSTPEVMAIAANIMVPMRVRSYPEFQVSPVPFNLEALDVHMDCPEYSPLRSPVAQRVIEDDEVCAICCDTMDSTSNVVYCMSSCGKSVHEACWKNWQTAQLNQGRAPACVHCRAPWKKCC